jgi:4-amino-4-deoxy-L-arabinose transferase-like glycosyltransferase
MAPDDRRLPRKRRRRPAVRGRESLGLSTLEYRRQILLLTMLTAAFLLPFAGKPIHIDDPMFLWTARHIQGHPFDFYGFDVNWYGHVTPMAETMKHPPLVSFYLALAGALLGWSEPALHLAFLLPALAVVLGTHALAARLCRDPSAAALSVLVMPGFLVSSTTLMSDVPLLALWVWVVVFWMRGLEEKRTALLLAAGALAGLAIWTKHFGVSLIPLLLAYGLARERRLGAWALALALPVAFLFAYHGIMFARYGQDPLVGLFAYARTVRSGEGSGLAHMGVTGLFFLGGAVLAPLFYLPRLWGRHALVVAAALVGALAVLLRFQGPLADLAAVASSRVHWALAAQGALFATAGGLTLALAVADVRRRRDAESWLLGLWLAGVFLFASFINWTVNVRVVLPAAPAAAVLLWRALDDARQKRPMRSGFGYLAPLAPVFAIALAVAWGDQRLALSARTAAETLSARAAPAQGTLWFQGSWGFQYYMERHGGRRIDIGETHLEPGDIVITPTNNTLTSRFPEDHVRLLERVDFPAVSWVGIFSMPLAAGFYTSIWGALPYAFGPAPPETYRVQSVAKPLAVRPVAPALPTASYHTNALFREARELKAAGRLEQARRAFEQLIELVPQEAEPHVQLGLVLGQLGLVTEAKRHFERALALEPRNVDAGINLAIAELKTGNTEVAIERLERVLRQQPGHEAARRYLEMARRRQQADGNAREPHGAVE